MIKKLYQALVGAIQSAELEEPIRHYDLWNDQVAYIEQETPFDLPACFVEFNQIVWDDMGTRSKQTAAVSIRLHIITRWTPSVPTELSIPSILFGVLHGRRLIPHAGTLKRASSSVSHSHEELIDSVESYTIQVWELDTNRIV